MYVYHINLVYQFDQIKLGISNLVITMKLVVIKLIAIKGNMLKERVKRKSVTCPIIQ